VERAEARRKRLDTFSNFETDPQKAPSMNRYTYVFFLCAMNTLACKKTQEAKPHETASEHPAPTSSVQAQRAAKTRTETTLMFGIEWTVAVPEDMKLLEESPSRAPNYQSVDGATRFTLSSVRDKSTTVETYKKGIRDPITATELKGGVNFLISKDEDYISIHGFLPNQTVGWMCSGPTEREADIRAMCENVRFKKQ
jgi:hypothetical protein